MARRLHALWNSTRKTGSGSAMGPPPGGYTLQPTNARSSTDKRTVLRHKQKENRKEMTLQSPSLSRRLRQSRERVCAGWLNLPKHNLHQKAFLNTRARLPLNIKSSWSAKKKVRPKPPPPNTANTSSDRIICTMQKNKQCQDESNNTIDTMSKNTQLTWLGAASGKMVGEDEIRLWRNCRTSSQFFNQEHHQEMTDAGAQPTKMNSFRSQRAITGYSMENK